MYSEKLLNLGRIHLFLLLSAKLMGQKRLVPVLPGTIHTPTFTDFGKEVENDEINWWIFTKETNIVEFQKRTNIALGAAQELKKCSEKFFRPFKSSDELTRAYEKFAEDHNTEIELILEYIKWLYQKDELAPSILFNYRVWGSTRMSDRTIDVQIEDLNNFDTLNLLTEVVLGRIKNGWSVLEKVRSAMEFDLLEKINAEEYENHQLRVADQDVQIQAAYESVHEFAEYFEQLRDCFQNINLDIERQQNEERVFSSDEFWRTFIIKASASIKTEQVFWDFKETLDMWHLPKGQAKNEKEHKFCELIGGFANNQGGVMIVGVTDSTPRKIMGLGSNLKSIENNMKNTRNVINRFIDYAPELVHFQQVNVPDENGDNKLCLVIVIRQTRSVVSVKNIDERSYSYPIREETGLSWKSIEQITQNKISIKHDNFNYLGRLKQFILEA